MKPRQKFRLRVINLHQEIYKAYEQSDKALMVLRRERSDIKCKKGCNACCKMQTIVSLAEATFIVNSFPKLVEAKLPELTRQAMIIEQISQKYGDNAKDGLAHENEIAQEYWALQLQCPFVGAQGECQIYAARPIPCRTHLVVSDPELCTKVPSVVIGHVLSPIRPRLIQQTTRIWFKTIGSSVYAIGSLQKMVLFAYAKLYQKAVELESPATP